MLVNTKAKVGVFSIALGAYLPQFPSLVPEFEAQYAAFKKTIPDTVEIIDGGMVTTKEQAMEAGDRFRAADVDLVFLQMLTYATSYNMLPAIRDLDVPVVLVNVQKLKALDYEHTDIASWLGEGYACGAVGEAVADLERAGKRHAVITGVVEGGDPAVQAEIEDWCKAAQVRRRFRETNIAQIDQPCAVRDFCENSLTYQTVIYNYFRFIKNLKAFQSKKSGISRTCTYQPYFSNTHDDSPFSMDSFRRFARVIPSSSALKGLPSSWPFIYVPSSSL